MTTPRDIREDLEPDAPDALVALAQRLERERPVPAAAFRGALRRRLLGDAAHPRPTRLRLLITAYASSGAALLLVGAASAAGIGPLAA